MHPRHAFQHFADVAGLLAVKVVLFQRGHGLGRVDGDLGGTSAEDDPTEHLEQALVGLLRDGGGRAKSKEGGGGKKTGADAGQAAGGHGVPSVFCLLKGWPWPRRRAGCRRF